MENPNRYSIRIAFESRRFDFTTRIFDFNASDSIGIIFEIHRK